MAAPPELDRLTVQDAILRYLADVERAVAGGSLSPATADTYRRDLAEFERLAGPSTILDDLTAQDLDDITLAYSAEPDRRYTRSEKPSQRPGAPATGRGPAATARFRQSVSRLFSVAERRGWIAWLPTRDCVVRPKARGLASAARKAPSEETARALLAQPAQAYADSREDRRILAARDDAILHLLLESGPRVAELCALDQADLESRDGTDWLHIRNGKGGKPRSLPLSPETAARLRAWLATPRPSPPARATSVQRDDAARAMFISYRGLRIQPRGVQEMLARMSNGLPPSLRRHITPHATRHAAATLLLSSGAADVRTVQALLGHESLATTGIYLDVVSSDAIRAVADHPVTAHPHAGTPSTPAAS